MYLPLAQHNMMVVTSGAGTAYPSWAAEFTSSFYNILA